jgi:DNA-binding transcriptional ArsR family regulator
MPLLLEESLTNRFIVHEQLNIWSPECYNRGEEICRNDYQTCEATDTCSIVLQLSNNGDYSIGKRKVQVRALHHPAREDIRLSDVLYALSDPTRQSIVKELAGKTGMSCKCKDFEVDVAKSTVSHHMKVLREAGVTQTQLSGTMSFISLRREDLDARFPGLLGAILGACASEERDAATGGVR